MRAHPQPAPEVVVLQGEAGVAVPGEDEDGDNADGHEAPRDGDDDELGGGEASVAGAVVVDAGR